MAGLTFTVVGDAFFASADNGASTSTATITLRSDRKAAFLLTKVVAQKRNEGFRGFDIFSCTD